jgi:hypothetical protein
MIQAIPQITIKPGYRPQSEDKTPLADAIKPLARRADARIFNHRWTRDLLRMDLIGLIECVQEV